MGVAITDIFTGMYATIGVLAALRTRDRTGAGQHIDLALLDAQVACSPTRRRTTCTGGMVPRAPGQCAIPTSCRTRTSPTADGHMILAVGNDGQFASFCEVAGRPDLARDPRFSTNAARVPTGASSCPLVGALAARSADWIAALEAAKVPCGPINDLAEVFADPQVVARGLRMDAPGTVPMVRSPLRLEGASPCPPPPALGAHTDEVLVDLLGMSRAEVAALRESGVL